MQNRPIKELITLTRSLLDQLTSGNALYVATVFFILLMAALNSHGYHHPDEHFQILEFAKYRLGESQASELPWEYEAKIRPAIQPVVAMSGISGMRSTGISSPIMQATMFRLITAILWGWLLILYFRKYSYSGIPGALMATAVWFLPYILVRFSSESWSALLLWTGIFFILSKGNLKWFLAGMFFVLSFFFRFQVGFSLAGIAVWMLVTRHYSKPAFVWLIAGGSTALLAGLVADRWFYGDWVLTPVNYFHVNILESKAAEFGRHPWWYYLYDFVVRAIPPVSILLLITGVKGAQLNRERIFLWVFIPFLVLHSLVSHKELRFLFPMILPALFWSIDGLLHFRLKYSKQAWWRVSLAICLAVNSGALIFILTQPASDAMPYFRFLEDECQHNSQKLWAEKEDPYCLAGIPANFYKPKNLLIRVFDKADNLPFSDLSNGDLILFRNSDKHYENLKNNNLKLKFSRMPSWLKGLNFGGWQERSNIWEIWEVKHH